MKSELLAEFDLKLSLYNVLIHRQINQLEKKIEKYLWKTFFPIDVLIYSQWIK